MRLTISSLPSIKTKRLTTIVRNLKAIISAGLYPFFKFKFESNNWYSTTAMETHHKRTAVESDINTGQESTSHEAICALIRMLEAQSKRFEEENEKLKAEIVELKNQVACFKFETTLTRRQ